MTLDRTHCLMIHGKKADVSILPKKFKNTKIKRKNRLR